jgi:hypothetical protein
MIDVSRQTQTATTTEATVTDLFSLVELLREPRLAQLYTYFLQQGPITVEQSIEELGMARSTAYKDVNRLAELGVLTKNKTVEPIEVSVDPVHLRVQTEHGEYEVSPVLIDAVGQTHQRENEDIATFVERNGLATLAAAIDYAAANYSGEITQRMAARELDIHPVEGITIITALRTVLADAVEYDPYFEIDEDALTDE